MQELGAPTKLSEGYPHPPERTLVKKKNRANHPIRLRFRRVGGIDATSTKIAKRESAICKCLIFSLCKKVLHEMGLILLGLCKTDSFKKSYKIFKFFCENCPSYTSSMISLGLF